MDNNFIVKVESKHGVGTAFLHYPKEDSRIAYAITTRHNFTDKKSDAISTEGVTLSFFDEKRTVYEIQAEDRFLFGENFKTEDFAVIVFPRSKAPVSDSSSQPSFSTAENTSKSVSVKGIPKVVNNEEIRSLFKVELLTDKDFVEQLQLEISDPLSEYYNSDDLVEGYSGSPIFFESGTKTYILGLFLGYEALTKRILAMDLTLVSKKLKDADFPGLLLETVETDPTIILDINKIRTNSLRVLNRISAKIGELVLPRTDLVEAVRREVLSNPFTLVTGKAGIGKSALTKEALLGLSDDFEIFVLQGEQLDKSSIAEIFSESVLDVLTDFDQLLDSPGLKARKILLLDSIEKLMETSNADTVIDFFNLLNQRKDLKIVMTCRSYAVEQLKIRFLQHFPSFAFFGIPGLNDAELELVASRYPGIRSLLGKSSLKSVLRIPFNLDKATYINPGSITDPLYSEIDFKRLVWEYVVEGRGSEADSSIRKKRGEVFKLIASERARKMTPYVIFEGDEDYILQTLLKDNLIEQSPTLNSRYAVSHDIYEDWTLTRIIEEFYNDIVLSTEDYEGFFLAIGYSPAMRRSFRIWISERIQSVDFNLKQLIQSVLQSKETQSYWKDEIIIAVMQSDYSKSFLQEFKKILFANDFSLLRRCMLLLNVACQEPDFTYLGLLEENEKMSIYRTEFLKPYGPGWGNMVGVLYQQFDNLGNHFETVIPLLLQWGKGLDVTRPFPGEARTVALILLKYLQLYEDLAINEEKFESRHYLSKVISLLFKLVRVAKDEIRTLLDQAISYDKTDKNYRIRNLWEEVIRNVLSWSNSREICKELPGLVIQLARKEWFFYPPTEDELDEVNAESPFKSLPRERDKNELFGIVNNHNLDYFPASAFQSPISHLLQFAPELTLRFIAELFNHSVAAFRKSDFLLNESIAWSVDERKEISFQLPNGNIQKQYGSLALWLTYRGTKIATPYLLQTVLMALEGYLLQVAEAIEQDKENKHPELLNRLYSAFDILLQESNSVSTTAVLVSIALAHETLTAKKIMPLLSVKEYYRWDLHRCIYDPEALAPFVSKPNGYLFRNERIASNKLPHRQSHLERLVLKLSLGEYSSEIREILDVFYAENSQDENWKFMLNRMDARKLEVVGEVEGGLIVQPRIDDDLKPAFDKSVEKYAGISVWQDITSWTQKKFKNEPLEGDSFEQWQKYFELISKTNLAAENTNPYANPAGIAAIAIRDYIDQLSEAELEWCVNRIFAVIEYEIEKSFKPYDLDRNPPFGFLETEPAYSGLIEIVAKLSGSIQAKAKELVFVTLIYIHEEASKEFLKNAIEKTLTVSNPGFVSSCIAGLVEYSKISELRIRLQHEYNILPYNLPSDEQRDRIKVLENEYISKLNQIIFDVCNEKIELNYEDLPCSHSANFFLFQALSMIPVSCVNDKQRSYYTSMLEYVFNELSKEERYGADRIHHEQLDHFENQLAGFLLNQPWQISSVNFKVLVDWVFEEDAEFKNNKFEFVERCLEYVLVQAVENESYQPNFWSLWEVLASNMLTSDKMYFSQIILCDYQYLPSEDWAGIRGKKTFFDRLFTKQFPLKSIARFLSGIGYKEMLPDSLIPLSSILKLDSSLNEREMFYLDRLVIRVFYDKELRRVILDSFSLRNSFIKILDVLINQNSASAFLIREDFISKN